MDDVLINYQRWERYRLAGKTFKYRVYVAFEILFVFLSVAAILAAIVGVNKPTIWVLSSTALFFSWLHHAKYFFYYPQIFLTCLTWALIFYLIYDLWLSSVFGLPKAGPLLLLLSGVCYLIRGENLVNGDAASELIKSRSPN